MDKTYGADQQWQRRGEYDATLAALTARLVTLESALALINTANWPDWTPVLTQNVVVAKTINNAKYLRVGRLVMLEMMLTVTGSGTAANVVRVTGLPVAAASGAFYTPCGTGLVVNSSTGDHHTGLAFLETTTEMRFLATRTSGVLGTQQFTGSLSAGDGVRMTATYRAAS